MRLMATTMFKAKKPPVPEDLEPLDISEATALYPAAIASFRIPPVHRKFAIDSSSTLWSMREFPDGGTFSTYWDGTWWLLSV